MIRPTATPFSKSRADSLVLTTRIIAKITGVTFEEAFETIHGETAASMILDPIWIEKIPELDRPMREQNIYYKVVEYKWGMRILSVELWYVILGREDTGQGAWPVHSRVRISDFYSREAWTHFGKTDYERICNEWILRGGKVLWIPEHYSSTTRLAYFTIREPGVGEWKELDLSVAIEYLNSVKNIVRE